MKIDELTRALAGIPHMSADQGREVFEFIRENGCKRCLELGFAHGVGTAYMASAIAENGGGKVVTIDLESAKQRAPDIHATLALAGVDPSQVEIFFEPTSYTWRMMKLLEGGQAGSYDFVYLDGAHSWFVDGLAFHLAEKLLRPGGWILFDDLNWRFDDPGMPKYDWVQAMPADEKSTPQVRMIWELLVKTHPGFDALYERGNWGYARNATAKTEHTVVYKYYPLVTALIDLKNFIRWRVIR